MKAARGPADTVLSQDAETAGEEGDVSTPALRGQTHPQEPRFQGDVCLRRQAS